MYGDAKQLLPWMQARFTNEFANSIGWLVLVSYPFNADDKKLVLLARMRDDYADSLSEAEKAEIKDEIRRNSIRDENGKEINDVEKLPYWLGVDVLIPGYKHTGKRGFPSLVNFSVSFYQKVGEPSDVLGKHALTLASAFFAKNRAWFERKGFQDLVFCGTESMEKNCTRPTRYWNASEIGHVTDLTVEFVRVWCKV